MSESPADGSSKPPETPSPPSRRLTFLMRLGSTVGLWGVALAILLSGSEPLYFVLLIALGLTALYEYFQMLENRGIPCFSLFGMICGAVFFTGSFWMLRGTGAENLAMAYDFEITVLLLFVLGVFARQLFVRQQSDKPALQTMAYTLFGLLYVVWLFSFLTKLMFLPPRDPDGAVTGYWYILYLVSVTKFSDMGAYLTGMLIGKHPMVPHISPKKTWEGFVGALVFSAGASAGLVLLLPQKLSYIGINDALIIGAIIGLVAVIGDLAESLIKRSTQTKDSGTFLPGIGGALDLVDSLLFTGPVLYLYLRFFCGL